MPNRRAHLLWTVVLLGGTWSTCAAAAGAEPPSVELALSFKPSHEVEYETPSQAEYDQCEVNVERGEKTSGWVVLGPQGQRLRRFVDTNGDNVVDEWRYYRHGLEVYRDIDSDFNNKVDQSRWLNMAGSRWAVDEDEDGRIDSWKVLSAEELSREAVRALANGDEHLLQSLLVTEADLRQLGLADELSRKILEAVSEPGRKLRDRLSNSRIITSGTRWLRFDGSMPSVIPGESGKAAQDLTVYENGMAIIETGDKPGLVQLGELVRAGSTWKLTQIPRPLEGDSAEIADGGILMQPAVASSSSEGASSPAGMSGEMQQVLRDLQKLDENSPSPADGAEAVSRYNTRRAELLSKLVELSESPKAKNQWLKQMADGLAAAVQTGQYSQGLQQLKSLEQDLRRSRPNAEVLPYVTYRRLLAEYTLKVQQADADERQDVQDWWLKQLEDFVDRNPDAEDTPEALLQLAITKEFAGNIEQARQWYGRLADRFPESNAGQRAAGALRRLNLEGKTLQLTADGLRDGTIDASDYRGNVLLVFFWATWCQPCTEDLPRIRALYEQHHDRGFEILGVNLDTTVDPVEPFLQQHEVPWPQIHEPGGLESPPARKFGIISLPTMFLVDADGRVISRNISVADLEERLPQLLKDGE